MSCDGQVSRSSSRPRTKIGDSGSDIESSSRLLIGKTVGQICTEQYPRQICKFPKVAFIDYIALFLSFFLHHFSFVLEGCWLVQYTFLITSLFITKGILSHE